jgi:hypothetical protein
MAESGRAARRGRAASEEQAERAATRRVVLRRERVLVLPAELTDEQLGAVFKAAGDAAKAAKVKVPQLGEAWTVVGEFEGDKRKAIEAHAGVPNTPDAKPGTYKAPSVSAFAGGRHYERPPAPKVEASDID